MRISLRVMIVAAFGCSAVYASGQSAPPMWPANSDATRGHGTHTAAAIWKDYLAEFMWTTENK